MLDPFQSYISSEEDISDSESDNYDCKLELIGEYLESPKTKYQVLHRLEFVISIPPGRSIH